MLIVDVFWYDVLAAFIVYREHLTEHCFRMFRPWTPSKSSDAADSRPTKVGAETSLLVLVLLVGVHLVLHAPLHSIGLITSAADYRFFCLSGPCTACAFFAVLANLMATICKYTSNASTNKTFVPTVRTRTRHVTVRVK